jgi:aryl-alcohol dehydrogenase-like predicted oxidoreductase
MNNKALPNTKLAVGRLGFDMAFIGIDPLLFDQELQLLNHAVLQGVNYLDVTTENAQALVAKLLPKHRDKLFLAVSIGDFQTEENPTSATEVPLLIQTILNRLGTTYLDGVFLNRPTQDIVMGKTGHVAALKLLKEKAIVKNIGVRLDTYAILKTLLEKLPVDIIQLPFHLFNQTSSALFVFIKAKKTALVAESPLYHGWLTGRPHDSVHVANPDNFTNPTAYQRRSLLIEKLKKVTRDANLTPFALGFVYSFDTVAVALPAIATKEELDELLIAEEFVLSYKQKNELIDFYNTQIKNQPML